MAKRLIGLQLHEFSLVRGDDKQPANQECKAEFYKSSAKGDGMKVDTQKTQQTAPAPTVMQRAAKSLMDAATALLGKDGGETEKATRVVESTSEYSSTSSSRTTETMEEAGTGQQPAGDNGEMAMATGKVEPVAGDPQVAQTMDTVAKAIVVIGNRLAKLETQPVGSRVLKTSSSGILVQENSGTRFPEFTKFLLAVSALSPGQKLTKATISTSGWTYGLSNTEAGAFIDYVVDQSTLLKLCRTIPMKDNKQRIDKIGLGGTVLKKGIPGTDPGDTVSLSGPTQVELDAEEVVAIVSIGDDTLEDNIEGEAFVQHLLGMIARAAANELEQAGIHGDVDVADDGILDRWDGWYKLAKAAGAHVIDAMTHDNRYWPGTNAAKATQLIKALPTKYRQDLRNLAMILHPDLYLDYNDELAGKGASDAFAAITGLRDLPVRGIRNVQVPLLKTDMAFTSGSAYTDGTVVILTDLRNLLFGIHRQIKLEPFRQPRKRCTDYVLSMRAAVEIENGDAIAIYDHAAVKA